MSFEESIQKWVSLDNQLRSLQDKTKQIREDKNNIEDGIIKYVDTHNLQNSVVKISDGKLKFTMVKQTNPLTLKYVDECLGKCIKNPEQVKLIMNYIKDSRNSKIIPDIKRFYTNN
jgi:cystathionine beta-lyase family protein involved in aluminum resistance